MRDKLAMSREKGGTDLRSFFPRVNSTYTVHVQPTAIITIIFLQAWHQSMPGNESFAWDHMVVWSSDAITQSFHLHFYDPQLYSGELSVPFSTMKLPLHS